MYVFINILNIDLIYLCKTRTNHGQELASTSTSDTGHSSDIILIEDQRIIRTCMWALEFTFICALALLSSPSVVWRLHSGPSGMRVFNRSRHKRRWARLKTQEKPKRQPRTQARTHTPWKTTNSPCLIGFMTNKTFCNERQYHTQRHPHPHMWLTIFFKSHIKKCFRLSLCWNRCEISLYVQRCWRPFGTRRRSVYILQKHVHERGVMGISDCLENWVIEAFQPWFLLGCLISYKDGCSVSLKHTVCLPSYNGCRFITSLITTAAHHREGAVIRTLFTRIYCLPMWKTLTDHPGAFFGLVF